MGILEMLLLYDCEREYPTDFGNYTDQGIIVFEVLIANLIALTDEALLMPFTHVRKVLIVSKETFATKVTHRVHTALYAFLSLPSIKSMMQRGQVEAELILGVQDMLVSENLLVPDA